MTKLSLLGFLNEECPPLSPSHLDSDLEHPPPSFHSFASGSKEGLYFECSGSWGERIEALVVEVVGSSWWLELSSWDVEEWQRWYWKVHRRLHHHRHP